MTKTNEITEIDLVPEDIRNYLLHTLSFSKTRTINVYSALGYLTIDLIQNDPYVIMRARDIAFKRADDFARGAPFYIAANDPRRLKAAVESGFFGIEESEGHTFTSRQDVVRKAYNTSGVTQELINQWLDKMIEDETIAKDIVDGVEVLGLVRTWKAEKFVADWLKSYARNLSITPGDLNPALDADQLTAVHTSLNNPVTVITGGPGSGKSFVVGEITKHLTEAGKTFNLMAPTGKAAARMAELSGYPASTIHKYVLSRKFPKKDVYGDRIPAEDPDVIIIDESSMMTLHVFHWLISTFNGTMIIVGDADQLPAIGAGQVLHDLIASDVVPVVELKTNHRSAEVLGISEAANAMIAGQIPNIGTGFAWVQQTADSVSSTMAVYKRFGEEMRGAPALAYTNAEVHQLNEELRELYNPTGDEYRLQVGKDAFRLFRVNDPVKNTKNNYDMNIMNGEMGVVVAVDPKNNTIRCSFNDQELLFTKADMKNLTPAYASTVHSYQGSEADIIVVCVKNVASWQKWIGRSWIYTATTRARKCAILVGSRQSVGNVVRVQDRGARRTGLQEELQGDGWNITLDEEDLEVEAPF